MFYTILKNIYRLQKFIIIIFIVITAITIITATSFGSKASKEM